MHADRKLHTQSQPPTMKACWQERLIPIAEANTQKKTLCLSRPENQQHLNVITEEGGPLLGLM